MSAGGLEREAAQYVAPFSGDVIPPSRGPQGEPLVFPYEPSDLEACGGGSTSRLPDIPAAAKATILDYFPQHERFEQIPIDDLRVFIASDQGREVFSCMMGGRRISQALRQLIQMEYDAARAAGRKMTAEEAPQEVQLIRQRLHGDPARIQREEDEFEVW